MAIPEDQLNTWARIGAQTTSKDTYATVKLALDAAETGYHEKDYTVFLQGSYGNDTNIWSESDVDVVIRLDSIFTYDLTLLPQEQKQEFQAVHPDAIYTHRDFHKDVLAALRRRFGDHVVPGAKAVKIESFHDRRKADVLITTQHRRYNRYLSGLESLYECGISFHKSDGTRVINYPKQHRENLIAKNQETNEWFKHIVRILKNARQRMVQDGYLDEGAAPSYYIEGLLWNVPVECFGNSYQDSMIKCVNWLLQADRSKFICANKQYMLLDGNPDVTWTAAKCDDFLRGLIKLWKEW
ncbi:nucleotidyltransferase domain-containing protein [Ralstonia sp. 22111]|uniref:nucleotidyltransferase domain-containing protein n=1 Tax=Ralstonia sp. 22111 TaxID=3453878 RepID=UPI003F84D2E0